MWPKGDPEKNGYILPGKTIAICKQHLAHTGKALSDPPQDGLL